MEEINSLEVRYLAEFDPDSGSIRAIGPYNALRDRKNVVDIDTTLVDRIHSGEVKIHSCFLSIDSGSVAIAETKTVYTIDDVLHRIPEAHYADFENADIIIEQFPNKICVRLSEVWGGTYPYKNKPKNFKSRNTVWSGDTECEFLITKPNDPNIIYDYFRCYLEDIKTDYCFHLTNPKKECSIYTKRILENYITEIQ